jgi:hypothetical protein
MKTLCYSVRLESVVSISEKALKVRAHDGSEDILPKSCLFGQDFEVQKSDAYWIAAWILPKKKLQYSVKKKRWFDENRKMLPTYEVSHHKPTKVETKDDNFIEELAR